MYFTGTRGSLLGFIGGIIVVAIILAIKEREHKAVRNTAIGLLAVVVLLVALLASVRGTEFAKNRPLIDRFSAIATLDLKSYAQTAGFARFTLWNMAWQGVKEKPFLGWGQDNFPYVFAKYYDPKMYSQEQWFDRTHNVFFDWLIAGGFLGLLSYLAIFVVAIVMLWKRKEFALWEKAVFTGLITAYFIHNFLYFDCDCAFIYTFKSCKRYPRICKRKNGYGKTYSLFIYPTTFDSCNALDCKCKWISCKQVTSSNSYDFSKSKSYARNGDEWI
jgi:O-antigen ligase